LTIVSRLKKYQESHKIPIEDLCQICDVSKQMIYYWRDFGIRNWTTAWRIAKELKCKPEEIIGLE
jgi:hypothetical protein